MLDSDLLHAFNVFLLDECCVNHDYRRQFQLFDFFEVLDDFLRCDKAVFYWHIDIHDYDLVRRTAFVGCVTLLDAINGKLPIILLIHLKFGLGDNHAERQNIVFIVIDDQNFLARARGEGLPALRC